jgi:hypothetical protein
MVHSNNFYKCLIGIIPVKAGIFCINFLPPKELNLSFLDLGERLRGGKRRATYKFYFHIINNGETNVHLLRESMKLTSDKYPTPPNINYELKGTFTFSRS